MPTWPAAPFPQLFNRPGSRETPPANVARSQLGGSNAVVRRRFTDDPRRFDAELTLSPADTATFESFFRVDLAGGKASFDHIRSRTGNPGKFRIQGQPSIRGIAAGCTLVGLAILEIASFQTEETFRLIDDGSQRLLDDGGFRVIKVQI